MSSLASPTGAFDFLAAFNRNNNVSEALRVASLGRSFCCQVTQCSLNHRSRNRAILEDMATRKGGNIAFKGEVAHIHVDDYNDLSAIIEELDPQTFDARVCTVFDCGHKRKDQHPFIMEARVKLNKSHERFQKLRQAHLDNAWRVRQNTINLIKSEPFINELTAQLKAGLEQAKWSGQLVRGVDRVDIKDAMYEMEYTKVSVAFKCKADVALVLKNPILTFPGTIVESVTLFLNEASILAAELIPCSLCGGKGHGKDECPKFRYAIKACALAHVSVAAQRQILIQVRSLLPDLVFDLKCGHTAFAGNVRGRIFYLLCGSEDDRLLVAEALTKVIKPWEYAAFVFLSGADTGCRNCGGAHAPDADCMSTPFIPPPPEVCAPIPPVQRAFRRNKAQTQTGKPAAASGAAAAPPPDPTKNSKTAKQQMRKSSTPAISGPHTAWMALTVDDDPKLLDSVPGTGGAELDNKHEDVLITGVKAPSNANASRKKQAEGHDTKEQQPPASPHGAMNYARAASSPNRASVAPSPSPNPTASSLHALPIRSASPLDVASSVAKTKPARLKKGSRLDADPDTRA